MAICGPKLSLCGVILSAWGIVQLVMISFQVFKTPPLLMFFFKSKYSLTFNSCFTIILRHFVWRSIITLGNFRDIYGLLYALHIMY